MAQQLWADESEAAWAAVRDSYASTLQQHASNKLKQLNGFYEQELPEHISSRAPDRHITQPELVKLVEWKLARGKWRPRLLGYAKDAKAQDVEGASRKAFQLLLGAAVSSTGGTAAATGASRKRAAAATPPPAAAAPKKQKQDTEGVCPAAGGAASPNEAAAAAMAPDLLAVQAALDALTVLKGVGPATASALLAAADSTGSSPFMADEALEAAVGGRSYTAKEYLQLVKELRCKADWLNQESPGAGWTAVLVERCLYAAALAAKPALKAVADGDKKKTTRKK